MLQSSASDRVRLHLEELISRSRPGDRLPSVRRLMAELGVSPATVRIAVSELIRNGRVDTISGNGTFVANTPPADNAVADQSWQTLVLGPSEPDLDLLGPLRAPATNDTIDLASGYPDSSLHPVSLIAKAMRQAARRPGTFDRASDVGHGPLRDWFAEQLSPSRSHNVLIAPGGQAALSLVFRSLGLPGDTVAMETPTYVGAIAAARAAGLVPVPVPMDNDGILIDDLETAVVRTGATLVYLQPRFQNPTGANLSLPRRLPLMELAGRRNLIVIEDDWLFDLDEAPKRPPLAADDPDGHVIHIRSLTKSVAPAVRIAGIAATGAIAQRIRSTRSVEDFFVSPILQETALNVVTDPAWQRHLRQLRTHLTDRQEALLSEVAQELGTWTTTISGGPLHIWVGVRPETDPDQLRANALRQGVSIASGNHWHPGDAPGNHIRLSNAPSNRAQIAAGIGRLREALDQTDR